MSEEVNHISKEKPQKEILNYESLREIAIRHSQELSGDLWTDYNVHDPGVTILEQLCFAITELGYRINFPIEDLLRSQEQQTEITSEETIAEEEGGASQEESSISEEEVKTNSTFYPPEEIFSIGPITITDLRKVLIDVIEGLRNCWIVTLDRHAEHESLSGLFYVLAHVPSYYTDTSEGNLRFINTKEGFRQTILDLCRSVSNLSEDVEDVFILDELPMSIEAIVDIERDANVDVIQASLVYEIENFISRPIEFYSRDVLLAQGKKDEEMFSGPRTSWGLLPDETLEPRIGAIYTSQIIKIIRGIDGVKAVKNLTLSAPIDEERAQALALDGLVFAFNEVPVLSEALSGENVSQFVSLDYHKGSVPHTASAIQVQNHIKYLKSQPSSAILGGIPRLESIPKPEGTERDVLTYRSIQNLFPGIYGLRVGEIPERASPRRKAQAKQLKAFLLFFEQVMANNFSQLANFESLLSHQKKLDKTYFSQATADVPGIDYLVSDHSSGLTFQEWVEVKVSHADNVVDRRHAFLNHLLARYGEQIEKGSFSRFNYYQTDTEFEKSLVETKATFLERIPDISASKARSFDYSEEYWGKPNIPGIEKRVKSLLGMDLANTKTHEKASEVNFNSSEKLDIVEEISSHMTELEILTGNEDVMWRLADTVLDKYDFSSEPPVDKVQSSINLDILKNGSSTQNFFVVAEESGSVVEYHLFFKRSVVSKRKLSASQMPADAYKSEIPGGMSVKVRTNHAEYLVKFNVLIEEDQLSFAPSEVYEKLKSFDDRDELDEYSAAVIYKVRQINIACEDFHVVDHLLLRERTTTNGYVLRITGKPYLLDGRETRFCLRTITTGSSQDSLMGPRNTEMDSFKSAIEILLSILDPEVIECWEAYEDEGGYRSELWVSGSKIAESFDRHDTQDLACREIEEIKAYFGDFNPLDIHDQDKIAVLPKYSLTLEDAAWHNARITICLPAWTSRMSDDSFRSFFRKLVREATPAHITIDYLWLDFEDMKEFEIHWTAWLKAKQIAAEQHSSVNPMSQTVKDFLEFHLTKEEEDA